MKWDEVTLVILAVFGCFTLLLTQVSEVLSKLPEVIRAWRRVRRELSGGMDGPVGPERSTDMGAPGTPAVGPVAGFREVDGADAEDGRSASGV
ncbi:hypothetical protein [Actinacidiphila guanduensis]|uniref:hypothetical protein n=1 Tax=Actinacidiphila guanduensis TaxID=310781 RepID=UPI000B80868E|nr:hypothetical protein [Actinacidiphila guanduensis]